MAFVQLLFLALSSSFQFNLDLISLVLSTLFTAAGGYVINDYFDTDTDLINKPDRVIIGPFVKRTIANRIYVISVVCAVMFGYKALGDQVHWVTLLILLLYLYSRILKRLPIVGNLVVAFCSGMVIYICRFFYDYSETGIFVIETYFALAFVITMIREIVKDVEDKEGDLKAGFKTFPIVSNEAWSKWFSYMLCLALICIQVVIAINLIENGSNPVLVAIVFGIISLLVVYFVVKLVSAKEKSDYSYLSKFLKIIMIVGTFSAALYL